MNGVLYVCDETNRLCSVQIELENISIEVCDHVMALSKIVTAMAKNQEYGSLEDVLKRLETANKQAR